MKRKNYTFWFFALVLVTITVTLSCSRITSVTDLVTKPSAREKYQRNFEANDSTLATWKKVFDLAMKDSIFIDLPYTETGNFFPVTFPVYSYEIKLNQGERLHVEIEKDSAETLVFLDLYKRNNDSVYELVKSSDFSEVNLEQEITTSGVYKLVVQPEVRANTQFRLDIYKEPVYRFPVVEKGNSSVQSYWGARKDGGRRSHEGIDIFAPRGTPVIAATVGRVSSTANKGLGGKQVWLRDSKRGNSLYYAHLDSIIATPGMKVEPGDTLGLIGNTGNAKTTPPHLHFGIYKSYRGAQNPLPYIYQPEKVEKISVLKDRFSTFLVSKATANLRKGPSIKASIGERVKALDTLEFLGKTHNWYHTRLGNQNFFIHESLARPL